MQSWVHMCKSALDDMKHPILLLSVVLLILMLAFFPEIQGQYKPYVRSSIQKRELFLLEIALVLTVLLNRQVRFPSPFSLPKWALLAVVTWVVWSLLSALQAQGMFLALMTYAEHITLLMFAIALYALVDRYAWMKPFLFWVVLVGFGLFFVFMLTHYFSRHDLLVERRFISSLIEVGFRNTRHLGYYASVVLLISIGMVARNKPEPIRVTWYVCFVIAVLAWALLFWVAGRGPLFALLVSFPFFLLVFRKYVSFNRLVFFSLATLIIGAVLSYVLPGGRDFGFLLGRLHNSGGGLSSYNELNTLSSDRLVIWRACAEDIMNHPFFGIGQNNYISACGARALRGTSQPHGAHIQFLLDWGVIGAGALVLFLFWNLKKAFENVLRLGEKGSIAAISFWAVLMLLVFSAFDGTLFQRFSQMFFVLFVVLAVHSNDGAHNAPEASDSRAVYGGMMLFVIAILLFLASQGYRITPEYITI